MSVYLDAVLHPAIYKRKRIFEQEGWHLEADEQGNLSYNGVVFNEMKGALSDPDRVLYDSVSEALFPDTAYGKESGGKPRAIPRAHLRELPRTPTLATTTSLTATPSSTATLTVSVSSPSLPRGLQLPRNAMQVPLIRLTCRHPCCPSLARSA